MQWAASESSEEEAEEGEDDGVAEEEEAEDEETDETREEEDEEEGAREPSILFVTEKARLPPKSSVAGAAPWQGRILQHAGSCLSPSVRANSMPDGKARPKFSWATLTSCKSCIQDCAC